jgi:hypothetical protein
MTSERSQCLARSPFVALLLDYLENDAGATTNSEAFGRACGFPDVFNCHFPLMGFLSKPVQY